jgi:uncharacterized protein
MGRVKDLNRLVNQKLMVMEDRKERDSALIHLHGVSLAAAMIAEKRGLNSELACMAGVLHDLGAYLYGTYDDHAHRGAKVAEDLLQELNATSDEENKIICSMIYHHDDKAAVDSDMDEVLKDADVFHHCFQDLSKPVKTKEAKRFNALIREFGLTTDMVDEKPI